MSYTFPTKKGTAVTVAVPVVTDVAGATLTVEFAYNSDFRTIALSKPGTATGPVVSASLSATEVDTLKNANYRVKMVKNGKTDYIQSGKVDYVAPVASAATTENASDILLTATRIGQLQVAAGTARLPLGGKSGTIKGVTTSLDVAANAAVIADINLNGTSIFTDANNRPSIAANGKMSAESVVSVPFAANSYLTFDVDQTGGPAAPFVVARTDSGTGAGALSTTVVRPSAAISGDLHLAVVFLTVGGANGSTTEPPTVVPPATGWTEFGTIVRNLYNAGGRHLEIHLYWKRDAGATEAASWTFTPTQPTSNSYVVSHVVTIRGTLPTGNPVDAVLESAPASSNVSWTAPSVTTTAAGDMLLSIFASPNALTPTSIPGQTLGSSAMAAVGGNNGIIVVGSETLGAAGATGTRTLTGSAGVFSRLVTASVAIKTDPSAILPGEKLTTTVRLRLDA